MFMDIEKLLALFPQANLGEKQAGAISFRQGDAFLNIPAAELSEKERMRSMAGLSDEKKQC